MTPSALSFDGGAGFARASASAPTVLRSRRESSIAVVDMGIKKGAHGGNLVSPMTK
jgi:hypothetical protein